MKMKKQGVRVTTHSGRKGKNGVYSAKHNDRNFDTGEAKHIDPERTEGNVTWNCYNDKSMTFEDVEKKFYHEHFRSSIDGQNERNRKAGHAERCMDEDQFRRSERYCPEEVIWAIGDKDTSIPPDDLRRIVAEQVSWEMETFPNVKVLNMALHVDEEGGPHIHERKVWTYDGKDGLAVGQNKALEAMGIEAPEPGKKISKTNNAKMTYTAMCRAHFIELCEEHGITVEIEPREPGESGLSLLDYKKKAASKELSDLENKVSNAKDTVKSLDKQIQQSRSELTKLNADYTKVGADLIAARKEKEKAGVDALSIKSDARIQASAIVSEANSKAVQITDDAEKDAKAYEDRRKRAVKSWEQKYIESVKTQWKQKYSGQVKALKKKEADLDNREKVVVVKETDIENREQVVTAREDAVSDREDAVAGKEQELENRESEFERQMQADKDKLLDMLKDRAELLTKENLERLQSAKDADEFAKALESIEFEAQSPSL